MIVPEYLRPGDTVAIAAPARKISPEEVAPAVRLLEEAGFNVFYDDRLFAQEHQFAGNDALRASYMQELLDNPDIKAVWCARGGYGSVRIIDRLDFRRLPDHPKWLCGYSDVTVFHSHLNQLGISTLHATMPVNVHDGEFQSAANQSLLAALQGKPRPGPFVRDRRVPALDEVPAHYHGHRIEAELPDRADLIGMSVVKRIVFRYNYGCFHDFSPRKKVFLDICLSM